MNGSDIQASFEVESMVRGYHCYSAMWIGEEPPCKLDPESIDLLWQRARREEILVETSSNSDVQIDRYLTVDHTTKNIIGLLIIFVERRDDYFLSYKRKTIFCFSSALPYS